MEVRRNKRRRKANLAKPTSAYYLNQAGLSPKEISDAFRDKKVSSDRVNRLRKKQGKNIIRTEKRRTVPPVPLWQKNDWVENHLVPTPDWFSPEEQVDVSVIVPMYKSGYVIADNITNWDLSCPLSQEIIYVDDACPHQTYNKIVSLWNQHRENLTRGVGKIVLNSENAGFGQACNVGAKYAKGKYLIFLNADTTVSEGWIRPLVDSINFDPKIGIVGNLHLRTNGTIDSAGSEWDGTSFVHIGRNIYRGKNLNTPYNLQTAPRDMLLPEEREMVTGACFLIPRTLFFELGGFDPAFKIGYWEDADLNMRVLEAGRKIYYQPASRIVHKSGHSNMAVGENSNHVLENRKIFYKRWVKSGHIEISNQKILPTSKIKLVDKSDLVVYTAITAGYDGLKNEQVRSDIRFVAFVDKPTESSTWNTQVAYSGYSDPNRNAKKHKMLPHLFFPDVKYSLWIDGSITIKVPMDYLIEHYMEDYDIMIHRHPIRRCCYQEAQVCIHKGLDDPAIIKKQIERYQQEGYPANNGLVEAGIILRKHNVAVEKFNEAWWDEIQNNSRRDQISFNYVAQKMDLKFGFFPGSFRDPNYPLFGIRKYG